MSSKTLLRTAALGAAATAILAACGGGGGDSGAAANAGNGRVGQANGQADSSTINNTVSSTTYPADSEELAVYNVLNKERVHCGFGSLKQDARLDKAAMAHAKWMRFNDIYAHNEDVRYPTWYTGLTPGDRTRAAGYPFTDGNEDIGFGREGNGIKAGAGASGTIGLLGSVYHGMGLLSPMKDVGISVIAPADVGITGWSVPVEILLGTTDVAQLPAKDVVLTYPCDGTAGVNGQHAREDPNPTPGRDLELNPPGMPIIVMLRQGQTLGLTEVKLARTSDGQVVDMLLPVTGSADPNARLSGDPSRGYALPNKPLDVNTNYTVSIKGTNNQAPFTKTFGFTTGGVNTNQ